METSSESWRRNLRNLYESFSRTDEELVLLRDIDQAIIERLQGPESLENVFRESLRRLSSIHRLHETGCCYLYDGNRLLLLSGADNEDAAPSIETTPLIEKLAEEPRSEPVVLAVAEDEPALSAQLPSAATILLQPLYENEEERLLAVLLFSDEAAAEGSRLSDPELGVSIGTVARQLSIAYDRFTSVEQEKRLQRLWELFLNSDLAPTKCFRRLAEIAREAYPPFGPLAPASEPEVQILVIDRDEEEEPHFMTIRGTTGKEPVITKIDIDESISGLLVRRGANDLPYFYDDPRKEKYQGIYKSYLGADDSIKSELALRLVVGDELVGVLNFESEIKDTFNMHHRAVLQAFADRIAPMVKVFEERIEHNRVMQLSVSAVTSKYLDSLASIFRHGVASPLLAFKGDVEAALSILDQRFDGDADGGGGQELTEVLMELQSVHDQIREFTQEFGKEISGFGVTGRFDLWQLLEDTVSLAERSLLTTTEAPVEVVMTGSKPVPTFCSLLFKQHFFSVLTNAIYSLQEKAKWDSGPHKIEITVEQHEEGEEDQEVELNRRWLVRVRDNGVGVSPTLLAKLREFKPDSHYRPGAPGLGLGLVALQRYMGSIEGWIELDSKEGEFFEVRLLFDEYSDDIHGPLSTLTGGAASDA
jgi:signal transduction histidine kinase